jgi:hypothetical protein
VVQGSSLAGRRKTANFSGECPSAFGVMKRYSSVGNPGIQEDFALSFIG